MAGCALAMLAPAACGGEREEIEAVEEAFVDLRFDYFAGDYDAVCDAMSATARRQLAEMGHGPGGACPHDMAERLSSAAPSPRDRLPAEVVDVDVDGDRATVAVDLGGRVPRSLPFVKADGRWRVDELFATSAPAAADMQ